MGTGFGAIVLAGGKSKRLGRDKAAELLLGVTLLQRTIDRLAPLVDEEVIVTRASQALPALAVGVPVRAVEDAYPETGPLGGIATGLAASTAPFSFVAACDMPLLQAPLLRLLLEAAIGHGGAVPVNREGFPEPLCAVYSRDCLPAIERRLGEGLLKITAFFGLCNVRLLRAREWTDADPEELSFVNTNTEESLARAATILAGGQGTADPDAVARGPKQAP